MLGRVLVLLLIPQQPLPFLAIIALMFSLHGMRAIPNNPANSITSMVKMLVVLVVKIKNPLHTVIQVTALSILAQATKDGV